MYAIKILENRHHIYKKNICICETKNSRFTNLQFTRILFVYVAMIFQDMQRIYTK